ncbi:MAG: SPOR domain-containing protein [Meiothermus sp.]|nr:SPOR domain-containing protein [Meiothermus sp.]
MGWLKSNWLDALIFLLVAVIMAGVVFFLTGTNPMDAFNGGGGAQNPAVSTPASQPSSPTPATPTPSPTPQGQGQADGSVPTPPPAQVQAGTTAPAQEQAAKPTPEQPKPSSPPAQTAAPAASPKPSQAEPANNSTGEVTVVPLPLAPQADANPVPAPPRLEPRPAPSQPAQAERPAPSQPAQTDQPAQVRRSADAGGGWRIAVGSFGQRANAERLATTLRGQGYPVSLAASGSNTRVWVGPYSSSARARAVAATLGAYSPQVARVGAPADDAVAPSTPAQAPAASPAPRSGYLQAGAFRSRERAQAVADEVAGAGFGVSVVEAGNVFRVRVGPVDDTTAAISALRDRGIQAVVAR